MDIKKLKAKRTGVETVTYFWKDKAILEELWNGDEHEFTVLDAILFLDFLENTSETEEE